MTGDVKADIVSVNAAKGTVTSLAIADGKMPNVRGLGAKDAMYLLEMHGLKARINGYGRVVEQSPAPGTVVRQNRTVYIRLQ
jgi:cell division protein FtsI (penicillin-binding protein 3)